MGVLNDKRCKDKVKEFLYEYDRKISKSRVPLTNVIETRVLIESGKDGIKITKNIFEEINKILQFKPHLIK